MFTKKMIAEIIRNDISAIPGITTIPKESDIIIEGKDIKINIKVSNDVNVIETAKEALALVRYRLVDKTDENDFSIQLIIK